MDSSSNLEKVLRLPPEQICRQAVPSLRGYVYQIYQSLAAWLDLKEEDTLLLEVAEDYAVLARGALTAVQVKDTASSVTLRSRSVQDAIQSFWDFQQTNPELVVRVKYLTASKLGKEKNLKFPGTQPGLDYWRKAARADSDVEPIRNALQTLDLRPDLKAFVEQASAEDLREGLLRRISWECGARDLESVNQAISDRLVYLGDRAHLLPSDSERARDPLIAEILRVIVQQNDRQLTRADLLRIFEKAVSVSMSISAVRSMASQAFSDFGSESRKLISYEAASLIAIRQVPLPPRIAERSPLVQDLSRKLAQTGSLWLHGSNGLGKTVLAQLIARRSQREWFILELRDCEVIELNYRLRSATFTSNRRGFGGIILDDFPVKHTSAHLRLSVLAQEVRRRDGVLVVTSGQLPTSSLKNCFGPDGVPVETVPYLTEADVVDIVKLAGGNPTRWARIIHIFCGSGHPQLVAARVSGLRSRNWPDAELQADLVQPGGSGDLVAERTSIRNRLLGELPEDARELLYRLSLAAGWFDRKLAIVIAEANPGVTRPGEVFDFLCGPWVEARAEDRFAVSPLVSDSGLKGLSENTQRNVHRRIVDDLTSRRPFPADFLGQLLSQALISEHEGGLRWLSFAVLLAEEDVRQVISEQLFLLPLLAKYDDKPILPDNSRVSALFRFMQFRVAATLGASDRLPVLFDRLVGEARVLTPNVLSDGLLLMVIAAALMELTFVMRPARWVPLLIEWRGLVEGSGEIARVARTANPDLQGRTADQCFFSIRCLSLSGLQELGELFDQLDSLDPSVRDHFLAALSVPGLDFQVMVSSAWLPDNKRESLDARTAASDLSNLAETARRWGHSPLEVQCICAQAAMLDEYANDSDAALSILDDAEGRHPGNARLVLQRARIYHRKGDYHASLKAFEPVERTLVGFNPIDQTYYLREAAISAAEMGDLSKAREFFGRAREAANRAGGNMIPMAIGLLVDSAVLEYRIGNSGAAVRSLAQALREAENIDPKAGNREKYCVVMLAHTIVWMLSQARGPEWKGQTLVIFAGSCSNLEPQEEVLKRATPAILSIWYQLVNLSLELGAHERILAELEKRTSKGVIIEFEVVLQYSRLLRAIRRSDAEEFLRLLPALLALRVYVSEHRQAWTEKDIQNPKVVVVPALDEKAWQSGEATRLAKDAILAFVLNSRSEEKWDLLDKIYQDIASFEAAAQALRTFFENLQQAPVSTGSVEDRAAMWITRLLDTDRPMSPDEVFFASCSLWSVLSASAFRALLDPIVTDLLVRRWQRAVDKQRFALLAPSRTVPAIQGALNSSRSGPAKLAELILAAEGAVSHALPSEFRRRLHLSRLQT